MVSGEANENTCDHLLEGKCKDALLRVSGSLFKGDGGQIYDFTCNGVECLRRDK